MNLQHFLFCFSLGYSMFDDSFAMPIQTTVQPTTNVYPAKVWMDSAIGIGIYFGLCLALFMATHFLLQQPEEAQKSEQSVKTAKLYVDNSTLLTKQSNAANRESIIVTLGSQYGTEDGSGSASDKIKQNELAGKTAREKRKFPPKLFTEREQKTQEDMTSSIRINVEADRVETSYNLALPSSFPKSERSIDTTARSPSIGGTVKSGGNNKRSSSGTYSTSSSTSGSYTSSTFSDSGSSSGSNSTTESGSYSTTRSGGSSTTGSGSSTTGSGSSTTGSGSSTTGSGSSTTESIRTNSSSSRTITTSSSTSTEDSTADETKRP